MSDPLDWLEDNRPEDWADPQWHVVKRVHNWRNYASEKLKTIWPTFTDEQKQAVAETLNKLASGEEWD